MANVYDYDNVDFSNRIKIRRSIATKNTVIGGIARSIAYSYNAAHNMIMDAFYGRSNEKVINDYMDRRSPIDTFDVETLKQFSIYLDNIISHWNDNKVSNDNYSKHGFEKIIKQEAWVARERCKNLNCLPEFHDAATPLPTKITESMLKKVDVTLQKAQLQTEGTAYSVIATKKRKPVNTTLPKKTKKLIEETATETVNKLLPEIKKYLEQKEGKNTAQPQPEINLFNFEEFANQEAKEAKDKKLVLYLKRKERNIVKQREQIETLEDLKLGLTFHLDDLQHKMDAFRGQFVEEMDLDDIVKMPDYLELEQQEYRLKQEMKKLDEEITEHNAQINKIHNQIEKHVNNTKQPEKEDVLELQMGKK